MEPQKSQQEQQRVIQNQSNLLASQIVFDQKPVGGSNSNNIRFDQQPVGGSKFMFSQFPQEGQVSKPVKKVVKTLKSKKTVNKKIQQQQPSQNLQKTQQIKSFKQISKNENLVTAPLDERPLNTKKSIVGNDQIPTGKNIAFDQAPIGKSNNFMMSEFPEGQQQPAQTTQASYPMAQKLKSKAIKLRLSGMEDLFVMLTQNQNSSDLAQVQIAKLMKQANPACLQKILQCYKLWIEKGKSWDQEQVKGAIQNGYINGKANTKKLTVQLCDLMYEQKEDLMERTILTGLKGKVAKSIQGYITITIELLAIYGIKKMKFLKPYIPEIVRILNNQKNPAVKTEAISLLKQAYKWMGRDAVIAFLSSLKQNFQKQLEVFWGQYDQNTVMSAPKDVAQQNMNGGNKEGNKKLDAYQISDASDIFKKFNQKWSQSVLKAEKWNQKTRLMQQLITACNVPKIAPSDYRHVQQMIKRLINDSNQQVVIYDLKILAALSKGIRKPFAPFVKSIFSNVISKFRDKKTNMIEETYNTLNEFQYCISIQDVLDDLKQGLGDKAPNMKVNLIKWIGKFVQKKIQQRGQLQDKAADGLKALFPIFQKLLQDGTADVRNCMVQNIAKMKLMIGDNFFDKIQNKMNKNQVGKVQDVKQNVKSKLPSSKDKNSQKDLSKSQVSLHGKQQKSKMTRTMNLSTRNFVQQQQNKRTFTQIGGKVDLSGQVQRLLPQMNDQKYWQKRKQSAQILIGLINQYGDKVSIGNSSYDLLSTLRIRINDPNKQLIKVFIHLTGLVFTVLPQRQVKANAKNFICALAQCLSDKNDQNRKQMISTLNLIGQIIGKQNLLATMAQYLQGNTQGRIQVINLLLMNQEYFNKNNTKDYPKGIIHCLCDKNKDIRKAAELLLQKVIQSTGHDIFRMLAKQQKPVVSKDINQILDKLEKGDKESQLNNGSTLMSKGVSPIRNSGNPSKNVPLSTSGKKKSLSKIENSFDTKQNGVQIQVLQNLGASIGTMRKVKQPNFIQGDNFFAPLRVLTNQRIQRQQQDQKNPWKTDDIKQDQQQQLKNHILGLIKKDIANKMISYDYRKVLIAVLQIAKICKDVNQQGFIRQIYDLIFKWAFLRFWGGNPSLLAIIQILPPVMSVLQKKNVILNDNDVQIIIGIIRQYLISGFLNSSKVTQNLHTIIRCLIFLSSGDRLLKKLLKQFNLQIENIHRHIQKEANVYYKNGLAVLIKNHLMEYMSNQENLILASRIQLLKNDQQFVSILYRKFHENILNGYGFKLSNQMKNQKIVQNPTNRIQNINNPSPQPHSQNKNLAVSNKNITKVQSSTQAYNVTQERDPSSNKRNSNASNFVNSRVLQNKKQQQNEQMPTNFDLSCYPAPHPLSPLGKNIAKLIPPNDQTNEFFSALFTQKGQKISNQLIIHAKIIFGSILQSVIYIFEKRKEYSPQKIVNQIGLLQKAIKCINIIKNVGQLLFYVTNFAINQLVYEDLNKAIIQEDLKKRGLQYNFIKDVNGLVLRILQIRSSQEITNILLDLLIKNTKPQCYSQRTVNLIIKCITKTSTKFVNNQCRPDHVQDYFLKVNQYISLKKLSISLEEFQPKSQKPKPQQSILISIKSTLLQICKFYKNGIWEIYDKTMNQAKYPDNHIASFVSSQGIPYPQKARNTTYDQIRKINQLLSKNKTFPSGIQKLKFFLNCNPGFDPVQYFTSLNYDHKFIQMVMNALQDGYVIQQSPHAINVGSNGNKFDPSYGYRKTPTKNEGQEKSANRHEMPSSQGNIQQKIKKLKMKFQQAQPKQQNKTPLSSQRNLHQQKNQQRAMEIKRRIDEMKNRMTGNYQRQNR